MAEEYQVTLEEKKDLYLNVFHEEHKNYKIYRRRERGVFLIALIYSLLGCLFNWIDAMRTGAWDREYFILKCYYSYLGFDILRPKHKNTCSVKN